MMYDKIDLFGFPQKMANEMNTLETSKDLSKTDKKLILSFHDLNRDRALIACLYESGC